MVYSTQISHQVLSILKRSLAGALNPFWRKIYIYMRILVNLDHPKEILKNRTTNLMQPDQDWVVRSTPCRVPWVVIWRYIWSSIWEGEERSIIRDRHDAFLRRMDIPHVEAGRSWGHDKTFLRISSKQLGGFKHFNTPCVLPRLASFCFWSPNVHLNLAWSFPEKNLVLPDLPFTLHQALRLKNSIEHQAPNDP